MSDNGSANFEPIISREQAGNAVAKALRLYVGRGRRYSVKELSNGTGVADRMIECAMASGYDHRSLPDWALLSIGSFLGPEFVGSITRLIGMVVSYEKDIDHDGLAATCLDYASEHARARHPDSPAGVDIAPCEDASLRAKALKLGVVA